jgi:hypothetical protein
MFANPTRPLPQKAAIQPGFAFSLDVILSGRQAAKDLCTSLRQPNPRPVGSRGPTVYLPELGGYSLEPSQRV